MMLIIGIIIGACFGFVVSGWATAASEVECGKTERE